MAEVTLRIPPVAKLQHQAGLSFSLGCERCADRPVCGGLQIEAPAVTCLDHCDCTDPARCNFVCPRNPKMFAKRLAEINGFHLTDIERRAPLPTPNLPDLIHLVYRSMPLARPIGLDVVAIPFSHIYRRRGKIAEPRTRSELEAKFGLGPDTKIVLSGVEFDHHVERWWGSVGRRDIVRGLSSLGVICATTPNFSLMVDVPRHDNLHAMKRIALVWSQLHDAKIPTALHVNGRTEHDFTRYREFLQYHEEIDMIAFEFTTGTATSDRGQYYVDALARLANDITRPLTLALRGGLRWNQVLSRHYARIVLVDTTAFVRTVKRKRAVPSGERRLTWEHHPTEKGQPLDELLAHNLEHVSQWIARCRCLPQVARTTEPRPRPTVLKRNSDTHDESSQLRLL